MRYARPVAIGLLLAGPIAPFAQGVPARALAAPSARLDEPFSSVRGVRELSDGRVIVVDSRDLTITVADPVTGATRRLSRTGQGPGEYLMPIKLFDLGGDTTFVLDMLGRGRGVLIVRDSVLTQVPQYPGATPEDPAIGFSADQVDRRGYVYSTVRPRVRGGNLMPDSAPIERLDRRTGQRATVAHWPSRLVSPILRAPSPRPTGPVARPMPVTPFASNTQWAVAGDGRLALVTVEPYQVTVIAPDGRRTAGPVVEFAAVRVTDAEKEAYREERRQPVPAIFYERGGTRAGSSVPRFEEPDAWPDRLPAFLFDALTFASDGSLWVKRATAAGAPPTFDVFDWAGRRVRQVTLPRRSRLVGFGNGTVYIVRLDDDDLEYLERHPLPR